MVDATRRLIKDTRAAALMPKSALTAVWALRQPWRTKGDMETERGVKYNAQQDAAQTHDSMTTHWLSGGVAAGQVGRNVPCAFSGLFATEAKAPFLETWSIIHAA
eukprot:2013628-Rhodomonas_salina.4